MKYIALIAVCFVLCFGCGVKKQNNPVTQAEVDELVDRWLTLWSTYDLNLLDSIFWNDPQMTYFSSEKRGLVKGFDQMKPHHEGFGFVAGGKKPTKTLWLEDINTSLQPDFAVVDAIWYFGDKSMPKDSVQNGPVTFMMQRNGKGMLRISHTHFANYK